MFPYDGSSCLDGSTCTIVDTVRTFVSNVFKIYSKYSSTDPDDRPSCTRRSKLHNHRHCQNLFFDIFNIYNKCSLTDPHDGPSFLLPTIDGSILNFVLLPCHSFSVLCSSIFFFCMCCRLPQLLTSSFCKYKWNLNMTVSTHEGAPCPSPRQTGW